MVDVDNSSDVPGPKRTHSVAIADALGEMIDKGEIRPGSKLTEEALAQQFGVSRGPIREALSILARENLVQIRPHLGAIVPELSHDEIVDLYDVRAALFSMAVRLLAQRCARGEVDAETLETLRLKFDGMIAAEKEEAPAFARHTQGLSRFIVDNCGNAKLRTELTRINRQSYLHYVELSHSDPDHRRRFLAMSIVLRDTVQLGDADLAADIAFKVVGENKRAIIEQFERQAQTIVSLRMGR